jgi:hypothetical protein
MKPLSVFLIAFLPAVWSANKPDLSGHWDLNVAKSTFGKMPKPVGVSLEVTHNGEGYHSIQKTVTIDHGMTATEGDWYLDGQLHTIPAGNMTTVSKWDGSTLVSERKSTDGKYQETLKLTVSSDGKTATEHLTVKTPDGTNNSTLVWDRK